MNDNKLNDNNENEENGTHGTVENDSLKLTEEKGTKQSKNKVLIYLCGLFITAFLLMLLSYLINQRNNSAAMSELTETHRTVTESAFENIEKLQDDNRTLNDELEASKTLTRELESDLIEAKDELNMADNKIEELQAEAEEREKTLLALEKLVLLESLTRKNDLETANTVIEEMEADSLPAYLIDEWGEEYLELVELIKN